MAVGTKPSSCANSKKTSGCTSPLLKSKNFFTKYVDILNSDSSQSSAASASHESVSDNSFSATLTEPAACCSDFYPAPVGGRGIVIE